MKTLTFIVLTLAVTIACNKPKPPVTSGATSGQPFDAVQIKLQEYAGASATNCGRLNVQAPADQSKTASDCAMQASQNKRPFYVAYDMPGMVVGVAGNSDGKLFTVQAQGTGPSADVTAGDCPAQLRVATSGRVTCFAPGDMGSMSGSHGAGTVAPGAPNPHGSGMENPHPTPPKSK
jgi:hypothetical protein